MLAWVIILLILGLVALFKGADLIVDHASSLGAKLRLSVVGVGMKSHTNVAARMFQSLAAVGIHVDMISTSEVRTNVVVDGAGAAQSGAFSLLYQHSGTACAASLPMALDGNYDGTTVGAGYEWAGFDFRAQLYGPSLGDFADFMGVLKVL